MTSKERIGIAVIAVILTLATIMCIAAVAKNNASVKKIKWRKATYTVVKGDTLWDIAKNYAPNEISINDYIQMIKRENNIEPNDLRPGQKIQIFFKEDD